MNCMTEPKNAKILTQAFLYDSHIWPGGFSTFMVALAHSVAWHEEGGLKKMFGTMHPPRQAS